MLEHHIYTSSFFNNAWKSPAFQGISIARSMPRGLDTDVMQYPSLAPAQLLLNGYKRGAINDDQYTQIYLEQLHELNPAEVITDILMNYRQSLTTPVLLCWEKAGNFCHRHIVADWLMLHQVGLSIAELS